MLWLLVALTALFVLLGFVLGVHVLFWVAIGCAALLVLLIVIGRVGP